MGDIRNEARLETMNIHRDSHSRDAAAPLAEVGNDPLLFRTFFDHTRGSALLPD